MNDINKVLIMGGNGFIGKNLTRYFVENGIDVDVYDLFVSDNGVKNFGVLC